MVEMESQEQAVRQDALIKPVQIQRPGLGRKGRPADLLCNYFRVSYSPSKDVYHYHVTVNDAHASTHDSIANKRLCRILLTKVQEVYGSTEFEGKRFIYDGERSLFTIGSLDFRSQEFSVILEDERLPSSGTEHLPSTEEDASSKKRRLSGGREFKVKIDEAAMISMKAIAAVLNGELNERAQDALRVLDIMLRQHSAERGYLLVKDNYFSPSFRVDDIGEGVQVCQGFHASFRPSLQGLCLNLDLAATTVIKPSSVIEFIQKHFNQENLSSIDWDKVKRVLKGIKVETPHTRMTHRILGFSDAPCSEQRFLKKKTDSTGNTTEVEVTVHEYYILQYNIRLKSPNLPCIAAGRIRKPTYIPIELCNIIPGQRYIKALSSTQRQHMIDQARQRPEIRQQMVQKAMEMSNYNSDHHIQDFNMKIEETMMRIQGRLLDPPRLKFQNIEETPRNGRWNFNNKIMAAGAQIKSWVVLNFDSRIASQNVSQIAQDLERVCRTKGMDIGPASFFFSDPPGSYRLPPLERVTSMIKRVQLDCKSAPDFMLCILPIRKTCDLYGPLKKLLQTKLGVITQCIAPQRPPLKDQYLTNVALKINAKTGGYNSWLTHEYDGKLPKVSEYPTIIFGLDVSHGPPGYGDSPSIAAVVASREWPMLSKYGVRLKAQSRKVEMISGLFEDDGSGGMVGELLRDFYRTCSTPGNSDRRPKQIIVFRDGVSESQFEAVLTEEFQAFKKACSYIDKTGDYKPKITFIVVQKRHHTRFFPAIGSGNVSPGTIVDGAVCHPRDYDFYLCAHAGLIGTTRPTHYQVLVDENNFTTDDLQQLTHSLCYMYARSTTAVSVVAPVAYAHLAATHARNFLDSEGGSETSSQTGKSERSISIQLPELNNNMKSKMFFC